MQKALDRLDKDGIISGAINIKHSPLKKILPRKVRVPDIQTSESQLSNYNDYYRANMMEHTLAAESIRKIQLNQINTGNSKYTIKLNKVGKYKSPQHQNSYG